MSTLSPLTFFQTLSILSYNSINLTSKTQPEDSPVIVLLSDTGSSDYLSSGYIPVDPSSQSAATLLLYKALTASNNERQSLHTNLYKAATSRTAEQWMDEILSHISDKTGGAYV